MPRATARSDIDSCGLTFSEIQELWLGAHPTTGSCFSTREELVAAWEAGRSVVMRLWGSRGGRRPMGWWEFDAGDLKHPGYHRERSYLYEHGVLSESERAELEAEWRREFDVAQGRPATERRAHLKFHDVPCELVRRWSAAMRRRRTKVVDQSRKEAEASSTP